MVATVCDAAGSKAQKKREAAYQTTLQSYTDVLKPGITRKYAEDYLRSKGATLQQLCCIDERSAFADLLKIGKEKHPWYCSEHNIYIAFHLPRLSLTQFRRRTIRTRSRALRSSVSLRAVSE
jgi:hypothetical protein